MSETPKFILAVTNAYKETHYFVALGEPWPHNPALRLIARTTRDRAEATRFLSVPEALAVVKLAGDAPGWSVEAE